MYRITTKSEHNKQNLSSDLLQGGGGGVWFNGKPQRTSFQPKEKCHKLRAMIGKWKNWDQVSYKLQRNKL